MFFTFLRCSSLPPTARFLLQSRLLTPSRPHRFVLTFFTLTYFLNRPCIYCSFLLFVLFLSSCSWSSSCWIDFSSPSSFFTPRHLSSPLPNPLAASSLGGGTGHNATCGDNDIGEFLGSVVNETAQALGSAAMQEVKRWVPGTGNSEETAWTGMGLEWLRSWLGGREWRLPCLDVYVRL